MNKRNITAIAGILAMAMLIVSGPSAVQGASQGIEICIRTVIPSLFPFFVLSVLITGSAGNWPVLSPLGKLFSVAPGAESILLTGLLGGYPVGAKAAAEAYRQGRLSKQEASRMLGFCSQPGPAFLFGVVSSLFSVPGVIWAVWMIQLISAWMVARILAGPVTEKGAEFSGQDLSLPQALRTALGIMAEVCGWVVLFRILIHVMGEKALFQLYPHLEIFLAGILELTNGCLMLQRVVSEELRFVLCSVFLSFGGLCVLMQTCSAARGLRIRFYLRGKILQTLISSVLAVMYLWHPAAVVLPVLSSGIFLAFLQKKSGNPEGVVV